MFLCYLYYNINKNISQQGTVFFFSQSLGVLLLAPN
ncbi:hypothetical protein [Staphylococcus phage PT1-4]